MRTMMKVVLMLSTVVLVLTACGTVQEEIILQPEDSSQAQSSEPEQEKESEPELNMEMEEEPVIEEIPLDMWIVSSGSGLSEPITTEITAEADKQWVVDLLDGFPEPEMSKPERGTGGWSVLYVSDGEKEEAYLPIGGVCYFTDDPDFINEDYSVECCPIDNNAAFRIDQYRYTSTLSADNIAILRKLAYNPETDYWNSYSLYLFPSDEALDEVLSIQNELIPIPDEDLTVPQEQTVSLTVSSKQELNYYTFFENGFAFEENIYELGEKWKWYSFPKDRYEYLDSLLMEYGEVF